MRFNFMQSGTLPVCSKSDMVQLLLNHPNMKTLRAEAGVALVQRQTGDAAGMALAVQAATAPTEGQRVLQNGYHGAIADGESREQTSKTIGADGTVTNKRLVERSVVLPDGGGLKVQQAVVVQGDPAIGELSRHMITMATGLTNTNKNFDKMTNILQIKIPELIAKDVELENKIVELKTTTGEEMGNIIERQARQEERLIVLEKRRAVESPEVTEKMVKASNPKNHKAKDTRTRASHPEMDWHPYNTFSNGKWGYRRALPKKTGETEKQITKRGYDTSTEAIAAMKIDYAACIASQSNTNHIGVYMVTASPP